jgi:molecular chaperone GrpE
MSRKKEFQVEVTSSEEVEKGTGAAVPEADGVMSTGRDNVPEPDNLQTPSPPEAPATEQVPSEEEKLRQSVEELKDRLLRTAAEFDNYRKRVARQHDEMVRGANERLLRELLDVADNFERALQHGADSSGHEAFQAGMGLIFNQVRDLLTRYGVAPIDALGQPFDPTVHEAVMQVESDTYAAGMVAIELSRGYRLGGRVLRHSKVGVSSGKGRREEPDAAAGSEQ